MVHKKYIKRGGKVFGPYLYENYRVNGITKTRYLGLAPKEKKLRGNKLFFIITSIFVLTFVSIFLSSSFYSGLTGKVTTEVIPSQFIGERIQGTFNTDISEIDNASIQTIQYNAEVGQPVKWKKIVDKFSEEKIIIELPKETFNVSVREINEINSEESKISFSILTGNAISESGNDNEFSGLLKNVLSFFGITGNVVEEQKVSEPIKVEIAENATNLEVEYYTEAPESVEKNINHGKEIVISGPDELHYTSILAYTTVPGEIKLLDAGRIKLYSVTNGRTETPFTPVDSDNDDIINYVEWNVPHLSNQTYELIIEINKAEHLDSNKQFVSDIYEQVKSLDDVWSETIPSNEYARVTFEQNLTNKNDITLYPRVVSGNPIIEVYEKDKTEKIAEFNPINSNEYNKILLTNLQESQDTFDLKVFGGDVQFDYIFDADTEYPQFSGYWDNNGSQYANGMVLFNVTVTSTNGTVILKFNSINYTASNSSGDATRFNVTIQNTFCYQESANVSTSCGGLSTGSYSQDVGLINPDNWYDGSWSSKTFENDTIKYMYVNYSIPLNALNTSKWYVGYGDSLNSFNDNNTISEVCWSYSKNLNQILQLRMGLPSCSLSCYNGSWINTGEEGKCPTTQDYIKEEAMIWDMSPLTNGTYSYNWISYGNGTDNLYNISNTQSYTINDSDTIYPQFSNYWDNNATQVGIGTAYLNVTVINTNGIVILTFNNINYTTSNNSGNPTTFNATIPFLTNRTYNYSWISYGNGTDNLYNISNTQSYTINDSDTIYPQFSNYWDNNATQVGIGTAYLNVTVINTNGTVILTFNNTNYTASNKSGNINVFNVTIPSLINGTYSYNWTSYGRGFSNLLNTSSTQSYTVNDSDSEYPQFSNYWDNNATQVGIGTAYLNVTVINTNGTVILTFNNINYTPSNSSGNAMVFNVTIPLLTNGTYNYSWISYGSGLLHLYNISNNQSYTINNPPQFSNYWDNNATQVGIGTAYLNVTVINTNGTVILTFNNTNYTASNKSGNINVFNVTIPSLINGTYSYNWSSYGNGLTNLFYTSEHRYYTINDTDTTAPDINFTSPTPVNASTQLGTDAYVNVSISDANNYSAWIDWNRSLVGWWSFESVNANGIVFDNSTYGNNGNLTNHATNTTVTGVRGHALEFDGINDFVKIRDVDNLDGFSEFSVSLWVKNYIGGANQILLEKTLSYSIYYSEANYQIYGQIYNSSTSANIFTQADSMPHGLWYHFVLVYNGIGWKTYLNGVLNAQDDGTSGYHLSSAIRQTASNVGMGGNPDDGTSPLIGTLDEVMIFGRALSPEEVNATYNAGVYKLYRNFTDLTNGNYTYKAYAIDEAGNVNSTETRNVAINMSDTSYPQFSDYWDNNGTLVDSGTGYFNVTLLNTNGTVILTFNNQNYTASNLSDEETVFNVTIISLTTGTYTYNWTSYGNGWSNRFNISNSKKYTVNSSDTEYPQFSNYWDNNGTQINGGVGYFNVTLISTNGTVILKFNNTNYTASNSSGDASVFNVTIESLSEGTYSYNWSSYGNGTLHLYNLSEHRTYTVNVTMPPNISNIWFYLDDVPGNISEKNKNLTIKVRATDDISLNETATQINVTYGITTVVLNATSMCGTAGECIGSSGSRTVANFSANFTPSSTGTYTVKAIVYDTGGKIRVSSPYTFVSYGTTTLNLTKNISSLIISTIDQANGYTFYINYTVNNTGRIYAYDSLLNFSANESIVIEPINYTFGNISSGTNLSRMFQINVSELAPPGVYSINATINWRNADNTNSSASIILNLTVGSNKSFDYSPISLDYTIPPGTSNSSILIINNTGNDLLTGVNLSCYTETLCHNFTISYNESNFNIASNKSRQINITLTASVGLAAGLYNGRINISEHDISKTVEINVTVPESLAWDISLTSLNVTRGISTSGDLQEVIINNTGNMEITFTINSSNSSIIFANVSSIMVPPAGSSRFMINYSAPAEQGSYVVILNITNSSASPVLRNITINLTSILANLTVLYPTETLNLSNVTAGMNVTFTANATSAGAEITTNITWTATINESSCSNLTSAYYSSGWNITCSSPNIPDGKTYNLTLTMNHLLYGTISQTSVNSIIYRDVSPPSFNITRNNVNLGGNINLQANVTDNVAVAEVWAVLTYPNLTQINLSLSLSAGLYINNSIILNEPGEYLVNYTANDTINNVNSTLDWFEVLDNYNWHINLKDYRSQPVADVNITLLRPNTTIILLSGMTNSTGGVILNINKRFYDINVSISKEHVIIKNANLTNITQSNISLNLYKISDMDLSKIIPLYKPLTGMASNSTGFDNNGIYLMFNYTGYNYESVAALKTVKCANWNYTLRECPGSWTAIASSVDGDSKYVKGNSTGFSSYFLVENKCGNGLCELNYAETIALCPDDCKETGVTVIGGGGGGGGGGASVTEIEDLLKNYFNVGGVKVETTSIYKEMFAGESATVRVTFSNSLSSPTTVLLDADGDISEFIFFETSQIDLEAHETKDVLIKIVLPKEVYPGNYDGDLVVSSGGSEAKIPVTIRVLVPEGKLLDVKILPLKPTVAPGEVLRLQTDLLNLGQTKRIDVQFDLQLLDIETGNVITRTQEAFAIETSVSAIKNLTIPAQTPIGKYMVKASAYYSNLEQQFMQASSIAYIYVEYPFLQRKLLGIPLWIYFLLAFVIASIDGMLILAKWMDYKKKRFKIKVEFDKLPHLSPSSIFIGKIAETGTRTFLDLNKLQMHTLVAGSTGSGKTIAAQDIVEGALMHKKSVIVFDPTAQWTGFFRPTEDKGMLKRYKYFDMKIKDIRGFNGTIKTIRDAYELINLKEYMNREGEITIFDISNLTPADIDIVVASTTEQIFKSQPEENKELKTLIVYDEVHRLLPKFGGSGKGFVQLERGAREFRKWGIGLVLISQVLSDFIGEIKANIGTEIQMGTRYEGDLERISLKYGEDMLKSVVRESIGTGMVVNAEYNSGKPYFVSFRPLYHSTKRLSPVELKKYEHYFDQIEDLAYQITRLEAYGIDVLDLKLELKISKDKVKVGQFQMVDMYLDSLIPVILGHWRSLRKNPEHLVREKINRVEVIAGISRAEREREKYLREHPQQEISLTQEVNNLRKDVEEKRKKGKNTLVLESKVVDLQNRLKPFKDKINARDAEGIRLELDSLKRELDKL